MTWKINDASGNEVLNSTDDLGVYLLDVITVGGSFQSSSYQVPAATRNSVTNYDYSSSATRIWPMVIPFKVWNYGWRPVLENWTGPTDTTFSVAWRNLGGSNVGDSGYVVYVFGAGSTTTTGTYFSWKTDDGTNEYLSENRAPMRYLSSQSVSTNTGYANPTTNGNAVLTDFLLPIQRASSNNISIVPNRFTNLSSNPWYVYPWIGGGGVSTNVYWFTSRWPGSNSGSPYLIMRDGSNRVFFDSREKYMRVLDIQVTNITPNAGNGHTTTGTTITTFSDKVPTDTSWGFFSNAGGVNPSPNSSSAVNVSGRTLRMGHQSGVLPSPVIAVAVDLTGL